MPLDSESLAALRSALPWWGAQGVAPLSVAAAFGLGLALTALAQRVAGGGLRGLAPEAPWHERARAAHPATAMAPLGTLIPAAAIGALLWLQRGPLFEATVGGWIVAAVAASHLGGALARMALHRWLYGRPRSLGALLRGDLLGLVLLTPQLAVLGATAACVRAPADATDVLALALGGMGLAFAAVHGGVPLLRPLGWVREAPARVQQQADAVSQRVGVRARRVEWLDWDHANAFAMPLQGRLLITRGACEALDDDALAAIIAHELGHLSEDRTARASRLFGSLALLPLAGLPLLHSAWGWAGVFGALLGVLATLVWIQRLARRLEQRADAVAHADEQEPGRYARALESLYRANRMPAVMPRGRPHPDLYDRMLSAGVTPDYPRPRPPSRGRELAALALVVPLTMLAVVALALLPYLAPALLADASGLRIARAHVIATSGAGSVPALAMALDREGRPERALSVSHAAVALHPRDATSRRFHAHLLARAGRCDEADAASREAERLIADTDEWTRASWQEIRKLWSAACPTLPARTASAP